MKKIFVFIVNTIMVFSLFAPISAFALAQVAPTPADYSTGCLLTNEAKTFSAADTSEAPNSGGQSFRPTTNRITKITAYMEYSAINKVRLLFYTNDQFISSSPDIAVTNETGYTPGQIYPISYNLNATVNPGQEYGVVLFVVEGTAKWKYIENNGSCDPTGNSRVNLLNGETTDMTYMVQGYNYVAPIVSTTAAPAATSVPKTTVSVNIKAPTEPKAVYDVTAKTANVSWKASATADIEGYIVSRSEDNKTFADLGTVKKDVLTYQDKNIVQEKTYYYQIKAYKGAKSSVASATTSVSIPKPGEEAATTNTDEPAKIEVKSVSFWNLENSLLMSGGILVVLLAITLGVLIYLRKKKNFSFGKILRLKKAE